MTPNDFTQALKTLNPEPETENELVIASAWRRIGAVIINNLVSMILFFPFLFKLFTLGTFNMSEEELFNTFSSDELAPTLWVSLGLYFLFWIVQLVMISKSGQTFGKRLLKIRIVKQDGSNPGFMGAFLLREVAFQLILIAIAITLELLINYSNDNLTLLAYLVCLIMLFAAKQRRTLQDRIAGTLVVNVSK